MNANTKQLDAIRELSATLDNAQAEIDALAISHPKFFVVAWDDGVNAFREHGNEIAMIGPRVWTTPSLWKAEKVAAQLTAKSRELDATRPGVKAMRVEDYVATKAKWITEMRAEFAKMEANARG